MNVDTGIVVVSTTVAGGDEACGLAELIVENRLAACVQRFPVASTYRWKGAVESAEEVLVVAKTRAELADGLADFIRLNHSYEMPEIIVTPVVGGSEEYLEWISASSGGESG